MPSTNRAKRKFLKRTSYYGQTVELDGQGRLLLPTVLRESAQTKGDVDVLGNLDYLEVMNHARMLDQLRTSLTRTKTTRRWKIWGFEKWPFAEDAQGTQVASGG